MKRAVVLFNLGGPDAPVAVRPFLFNLFNDSAIIDLPGWPRWLLARLISERRAKTSRAIYDQIGGKSPLLETTLAQADALQNALAGDAGETRVFIAMRYWHPLTEAAVQAVQEFGADEILLLPLYPQFSTATTQSSLNKWHSCARAAGLTAPSYGICCYPVEPGLIAAQAKLLGAALAGQSGDQPMRVLFSAHGLPEKFAAKGDPYPKQIAKTAAAIARAAGLAEADWIICYQSRVGHLKWISPSLDDALVEAARDGIGVTVLPLAFVSEHSETLVELDIDYRKMAERLGIQTYIRVPAVGTKAEFIDGLANMVRAGFASRQPLAPMGLARICLTDQAACPYRPG